MKGEFMSRPRCAMGPLVMVALASFLLPSSVALGDLLQNGGFDTPTAGLSPPNYPTSITGLPPFPGGISSADQWNLFNNQDATTSTELLPTTDPSGGGFMIHLTTTPSASGGPTSFNGLIQSFATVPGAVASVDVFVVSGPVIVALFGNSGFLGDVQSTTSNQWETLTLTEALGTNPNLIAIYSNNVSGPAEFYADRASVTSLTPEPATWIVALVGWPAMSVLIQKRRRRR